MPLPKLLRDIHYWGSIVLMVLTLVVAVTGILMAVRKDFHQLQPAQREGSQAGLSDRPISGMLAAVNAHPGFGDITFKDLDRIDVRPKDGVAKVILKNHTELQVDIHTLKVLQVGYRTSDVLETIHTGTIVGDWGKYVVSLPAGIGLLLLWGTGIYLFILPFLARARQRKAKAAKAAAKAAAVDQA
jgi:uncharacterized iron-regulated membrane protein